MIKQIYQRTRHVTSNDALFNSVAAEMLAFFNDAKLLIDDYFAPHESYEYNGNGFKTLTPDCEPVQLIEVNKLIIKDGVTVGIVILRGTNHRPNHTIDFLQDVLEREYELRFKTFAGCLNTVESAGIAFTQRGNGGIMINSANVSTLCTSILKRHWDEFKSNCAFDAAALANPIKVNHYSKRREEIALI